MTRSRLLTSLEVVVAGAAALQTAVELGMLQRLDGRGARALATDLGLDERLTGRVLDVLAELGVVIRQDGRYRFSEADNAWLMDFLASWQQLPEVVRNGVPVSRFDDHTVAEERYPAVVDVLADLLAEPARVAAERLAAYGLRVLDVGAGAAPWSIALCRRRPDITVTALDLPDVLTVTRRAAESAGLADRLDYLPGDVFTVDLPAQAYDLILVGNVCHLFDPARNRQLLARLTPALVPGGTLAVLDGLADDTPTPQSACYRLGLALRTPDGDVYPVAAYRDWLGAAGLEGISAELVTSQPAIHLIRAHRGSTADGKP